MIDTPFSRPLPDDDPGIPLLEVSFVGGPFESRRLSVPPERWLVGREDDAADDMRQQREITLVFDAGVGVYLWDEAPDWLGPTRVTREEIEATRVCAWAFEPGTEPSREDVQRPYVEIVLTTGGRLFAETRIAIPLPVLAIDVPELREAAIAEYAERTHQDFRRFCQSLLDRKGEGEVLDSSEGVLHW